jgi:hypothetical protein
MERTVVVIVDEGEFGGVAGRLEYFKGAVHVCLLLLSLLLLSSLLLESIITTISTFIE